MMEIIWAWIGKTFTWLLISGFVFYQYQKRVVIPERVLLTETERAIIGAAAEAAVKDLENASPKIDNTVQNLPPCVMTRSYERPGKAAFTYMLVYPVRKGNMLYVYNNPSRTPGEGEVEVLQIRKFDVKMVYEDKAKQAKLERGEIEPIKDGQLFSKGKTVAFVLAKADKGKSKPRQHSSGSEVGDGEGAGLKEVDSVAGDAESLTGERVVPLVPDTDASEADVPEAVKVAASLPTASPLSQISDPTSARGSSKITEEKKRMLLVFHFSLNVHKAEFYSAVVPHMHDAPTCLLTNTPAQFARARDNVNKLPSPAEAFVNAFLSRAFIGVHSTQWLVDSLMEKIGKKTKQALENNPNLLSELEVMRIHVGSTAPVFSNLQLKNIDDSGNTEGFAHVDYTPPPNDADAGVLVSIRVKAKFYSDKFAVNGLIEVRLKHISGDLQLRIPAAPSNRVWIGFSGVPDVQLAMRPSVGGYGVPKSVENLLHSLILGAIKDNAVLPAMDDTAFFNTIGKRVRGGVFDDSVAEPIRAQYAAELKSKGASEGQVGTIAGQSKSKNGSSTPVNRPDAREIADENGPISSSTDSVEMGKDYEAYRNGLMDGAESAGANLTGKVTVAAVATYANAKVAGFKAAWQKQQGLGGVNDAPLTRQSESAKSSSSAVDKVGIPPRGKSTSLHSAVESDSTTPRADPPPDRSEGCDSTTRAPTLIDTSVESVTGSQHRTSPASTLSTSSKFSLGSMAKGEKWANLTHAGQKWGEKWSEKYLPRGPGLKATAGPSSSGRNSAETARSLGPSYLPPGSDRDSSAGSPTSGHKSQRSIDNRLSLQDRLKSAADKAPSSVAQATSATSANGRQRSGTASSSGSIGSSSRPSLLASPSKAPSPAPAQSTTIPHIDTLDRMVSSQPAGAPSMMVPKVPKRPDEVLSMGYTPGVGVSRTISAERRDEPTDRPGWDSAPSETDSAASSVPPPLPRRDPAQIATTEDGTESISDSATAYESKHSLDGSTLQDESSGVNREADVYASNKSDAEDALRRLASRQEGVTSDR